MGGAIGQSLPLAVGVALSPIPIIAVVLVLAGTGGAGEEGPPASWVSRLKLVLGALLLLVAIRQFRGRPHAGEGTPLPKWMGAIDRFTPVQALGWRRPGRRQSQEPASGRRRSRRHSWAGVSSGQQAVA